MPEKRMLILPAELVRKIEENRGDMSQATFINYLVESHINGGDRSNNGQYVTREEFRAFQQGMKDLFRSLLDLFLSIGVETGSASSAAAFEELNSRLTEDGDEQRRGKGDRIVKIKWK